MTNIYVSFGEFCFLDLKGLDITLSGVITLKHTILKFLNSFVTERESCLKNRKIVHVILHFITKINNTDNLRRGST